MHYSLIALISFSGAAVTCSGIPMSKPTTLKDPVYGRHHRIKVNGVHLHYVENGDPQNPMMLLVHGFPEYWYFWREQLKHFAKTHWVVALDMRGFGESDKPPHVSDYSYETLQQDIVELIRALGRKSTVLVAHDWGGIISMGVTANNPDLISKFIVVSAPHPNIWLSRRRNTSFLQFLRSWYVLVFNVPKIPELTLRLMTPLISPALLRLPVIRKFMAQMDREQLEAYKYTFPTIRSWTPPMNYYRNFARRQIRQARKLEPVKDIPKITQTPVLMLWAEDEVWLAKSMPELCKQYIDNLRIEYMKGATHFILGHEAEVTRLIESFL